MNKFNKVKFTVLQSEQKYQLLDLKILDDGLINPQDLNQIVLPEELITNRGVIISGKAPIWLYAYLIHQLHHFAWVATFDPRHGAIVVQNHIPDSIYIVGYIISIEELEPLFKQINKNTEQKKTTSLSEVNKIICVVGGPAHSGKSVFIQALRKHLQKLNPDFYYQDFYIIRACPDGEGDWFGDIPEKQGKIYRYSGIFTDELANQLAQDISNVSKTKKTIIVDVGGKIDKKNNTIFSKCNCGIIVSNDETKTQKWLGAFELCDLNLLAIINSKLEGETNVISINPLKTDITNLHRDNVDNVKIPSEIINLFY